MIKMSADQEGIMILNMYTFNKIVSKYIIQKLTELQGEINKFTEYPNTLLVGVSRIQGCSSLRSFPKRAEFAARNLEG